MKPKFQQLVRSELKHDEKLLWLGHPDAKREATGKWPAVLIAIFGFYLFASQARNKGDFGELVQVLPYLVCGIVFLSAPLLTYMKFKGTVYAITDKRVLILLRDH